MKHTIEVEIPEGFEPVDFRHAVLNEQYLINGNVRKWTGSLESITEVIIVQPTCWKPADGEDYFYFSKTLKSNLTVFHTSVTDNIMLSTGNFFKTKEDCLAAAEKVSELLLKLKEC